MSASSDPAPAVANALRSWGGHQVRFRSLLIESWRQFDRVSIEFDQRVTIITGANGAGKSTLLRILSQHFGWPHSLLGTPKIQKDGALGYSYLRSYQTKRPDPIMIFGSTDRIGELAYSTGSVTPILIPQSGGVMYNVAFPYQQVIDGLFIGSHRPVQGYQVVSSIPTTSLGAQQAYQQYYQESLNRFNNGYTQYSPTYRMKEAIISMATFGPGNRNVTGNPETDRVYLDFEKVLKIVLPESLGFQRLTVRIPDVVLETTSGEFVLDSASGGIMSLVDLAWQVFLYSQGKQEYTVILDEPENHLHPSMQRSIIQSLVSAFPKAQFVVATHSPFIVSSVKYAKVYVLQYGTQVGSGERTVSSVHLDHFNRSGTASDILRDALGVPVTMPMWAEDELRRITSDLSVESLTDQGIAALRLRLEEAGLDEFYPEALSQIARQI